MKKFLQKGLDVVIFFFFFFFRNKLYVHFNNGIKDNDYIIKTIKNFKKEGKNMMYTRRFPRSKKSKTAQRNRLMNVIVYILNKIKSNIKGGDKI